MRFRKFRTTTKNDLISFEKLCLDMISRGQCLNVALLCVRGVQNIFSMSDDDAKRVRGRVWHHHALEISYGRQEHTFISLLFKLFANLTRKNREINNIQK